MLAPAEPVKRGPAGVWRHSVCRAHWELERWTGSLGRAGGRARPAVAARRLEVDKETCVEEAMAKVCSGEERAGSWHCVEAS